MMDERRCIQLEGTGPVKHREDTQVFPKRPQSDHTNFYNSLQLTLWNPSFFSPPTVSSSVVTTAFFPPG
jgi:hypothetical protein